MGAGWVINRTAVRVMGPATSTVPVEDRLPDALPQVRRRLELAASRWDAYMAELRRLVDRAEAYVRERGWDWELGPLRQLIDKVEDWGRRRIRLALQHFDGLRPVKTGKTIIWLKWRGEGLLSVQWPNNNFTARLGLGGLSATAVLGRGVLATDEQRLYWLGWRASDATENEGRPTMSTADLAQVLAWAPAVPGKMRIYAEYVGLTLEGPHVHWQAKALDYMERIRDKMAVLGKAFSTPLSALGHVLGDGSPYVKRGGRRVLAIAASGKALDVLARALEEVMESIGVRGKIFVKHGYVEVWGLAARRLAGWMIDGAPPPLRGLLDVTRFGKWTRLKAVAEPPREAPAIVVDGYRWGLYLHRNGLYAEARTAGAAEAVRGLGLSPRVRSGGRRARLYNTDTWRLIRWASQRDPTLLERVEAYLRHWLGTSRAKIAERELRKLARLKGQQ